MKKNIKILSFILAIFFVLNNGAIPVMANELGQIGETTSDLCTEKLTLLESDSDVSHIARASDNLFYLENDTKIVCYDAVTQTETVLFESDEAITYHVPDDESGALIGTAAPVEDTSSGNPELPGVTYLDWSGEYYYVDYDNKTVNPVSDPSHALLVIETNDEFVEVPNFSTTINGKAIPWSSYPYGSKYTDDIDGNSECHGFGFEVHNYLYRDYDNVDKIWASNRTMNGSQLFSDYPFGTFVRVTNKYGGLHTFIMVGESSTGAYIYHANWYNDDVIYFHYLDWSDFNDVFPVLEYVRVHYHDWETVGDDSVCKTCLLTIEGATINRIDESTDN